MQTKAVKKTNESGGSGDQRRRYPRRRSQKRKRLFRGAAIFLAGLLLAAAGLYIGIGMRYREIFCPNTVINGTDVSGLSMEEVKAIIDSKVKQYILTIETRNGTEDIQGSEIGLRAEYDGTLDDILEGQRPFAWGIYWIKGRQYEVKTMVDYEDENLRKVINQLSCMDPGQMQSPADAYLTYVDGAGYEIVPAVQGNEVVPSLLFEEVAAAIHNLKRNISLEELGVYREPQILENSSELIRKRDVYAPYVNVTVIYRFGSRTEILDGSTTYRWMSEDENGTVVIDEGKAAEYVKGLAKKYNTAYCAKNFKTSYGPTVSITSGHYGWMINQKAETEALAEILYSGKSQEREPVYSQTAASHDGPDYGDTYVELNLTAQHMYFYKNGKLLVESDFVSGDEAKGWSTPAGAFSLTYKQKNAVLKGKNYATPVTYWMPFNGNIGMHDGYWRSSFGGTIYKKNGSHGCVNLPPAAAKKVFENIEQGMPVLCYHLEGTENRSTATGNEKKVKTEPPTAKTAAEGDLPIETESPATGIPEESKIPVPENPASEIPALESPAEPEVSGTEVMENPETIPPLESPNQPEAESGP